MGSRSRARARAQASQPSAGPSPAARRTHSTSRQPVTGTERPQPVAAAHSPSATATPAPLPRSVSAAAIIQAIEALGVLALSVLAGVETAKGHSYQLASGVAITIIGIATAIGLALIARGVRSGRRWSRTPALLTQLFTGIVAIYAIQSGRLDWGVPTILLAIAGLVALLMPASVDVLTPGRVRKP